jgi:RNA 2',3'-cyclic 3'-phosphodiesterase
LDRVFVAVWLPPVLTDRLRKLHRPAGPGLRWTTEDQWHVTLRFLGEVGSELDLRGALDAAAGRSPPVTATLGPGPRALGDRVWVLPVNGLDGLATAVQEATRELVPVTGRRPFRGHVTLARARRPGSFSGLPLAEVGGAWIVDTLTLVGSHLHPDGARYEVIGTWALDKDDRVGRQGG